MTGERNPEHERGDPLMYSAPGGLHGNRIVGLALLPSALVSAYPTLELFAGRAAETPSFPLWLTAHQSRRHTPRVAAVWTFLEGVLADKIHE